jgi:hypothetical protein
MANDITLAIAENPIKNGTMVVNGRFINCTSTINILMNGNYTDLEEEAPNLVAAISSFGHSYSTFTDISASTFSSFSGGTLVIPELQGDDLDANLTSDAKDAIATFVSNGGTLLAFEPSSDGLYSLLNSIFGFSLNTNGVSEPINLTSSGLSLLPTAPSTIPNNDGTSSLDTTTLPPDSVTIYEGDDVNQSVVTMIPYGTGKIYVMGWDWYDGAPIGNQNGGWVNLLGLVLSLSSPPCDNSLSYGIKYNRYVQEYPVIADIQDKYDNRFDDPSYYYGGGGNVDGGDVI